MKGQVFNMANEKLKFVCDYMEGLSIINAE